MSSSSVQLEGFTVIEPLGRGARSSVFAARCLEDGRLYAVKQLARRAGDDDRYFDQVVNEHAIASKLDHPALRKTFRLIRRRSLLRVCEVLLVMEHVEGRTLDAAKPAGLADLLAVLIAATRGLQARHEADFVHADLKPENIVRTADGQVKLIDFGQSCPLGAAKERIQGTPAYIAPEQVDLAPLDARTDVFNFGATLFWCLTGRNLPHGPHHRAGLEPGAPTAPFDPRTHNPGVPLAVSNLVLDCIRQDRTQRPSTIREVRHRLKFALKRLATPELSAGAR